MIHEWGLEGVSDVIENKTELEVGSQLRILPIDSANRDVFSDTQTFPFI